MSSPLQTDAMIPEHILETVTAGLDYGDLHQWITWSWAALARAGDVPSLLDEEHDGYVSPLVTLAGLGHLYELFQQVVGGGDADLEPSVDLLGDIRPEITTIELARYCEAQGIYDTELPETANGLMRAAIRERADHLRPRLSEVIGEGRLFTSLFVAGGGVTSSDDAEEGSQIGRSLSEDVFDHYVPLVVNEDLTADKQRAYMWLQGELDLG